MRKNILLYFCIYIFIIIGSCSSGQSGKPDENKKEPVAISINQSQKIKLDSVGHLAEHFCTQKKFNTNFCFLIDMSIHSGRNRFFIYDMKNDSVVGASVVAHGCCNKTFLTDASFSNISGSGCSSLGKYKIGYKYNGRFGTAYKLYGLDSSNSNAFERSIVLHSYYLVPDRETYPVPLCNSLGCPMVSATFLTKLSERIDASSTPVLLWIF